MNHKSRRKPAKKNISPTYIKGKINPIKNFILHLNEKNLASHIVKGYRGRALKFVPLQTSSPSIQEAIKRVCRHLKFLKKVQKLVMWTEPQRLSRILGKNTSLKSLSLSFWGDHKRIDVRFKHFKKHLQRMRLLRYLSLDLLENKYITDVGVKHLGQGFKNLSSLTRLSVNLSRCEKVTDAGVHYLKEGLEKLSCLKHLSLNLSVSWITDNGLGHLKEALKSLDSLSYVFLGFFACSRLTDHGVDQLIEGIKGLRCLRHLILRINSCLKITYKKKEYLKYSLKELLPLAFLDISAF